VSVDELLDLVARVAGSVVVEGRIVPITCDLAAEVTVRFAGFTTDGIPETGVDAADQVVDALTQIVEAAGGADEGVNV
jgi:hypothetical protein